jgi:lipopolysaccharide export system protein LptA
VVLDGNVVVTQGQNVMNGDRLTVNLTTSTSKLDGVKQQQGQQRVKGVFVPSSMDKKDKDGERPSRKKQAPAN